MDKKLKPPRVVTEMPVYRIHKSIDIDFAHHVGGHDGACINIHGHTWKFEVGLSALALSTMGFVVDFKRLKQDVLEPVHTLLDHSFALNEATLNSISSALIVVGEGLYATRGKGAFQKSVMTVKAENTVPLLGYKTHPGNLCGAYQIVVGGMKMAAFPFSPTSERLAEWLYRVAAEMVQAENTVDVNEGIWLDQHTDRLSVDYARVYETLHPVESVATYSKQRS